MYILFYILGTKNKSTIHNTSDNGQTIAISSNIDDDFQEQGVNDAEIFTIGIPPAMLFFMILEKRNKFS